MWLFVSRKDFGCRMTARTGLPEHVNVTEARKVRLLNTQSAFTKNQKRCLLQSKKIGLPLSTKCYLNTKCFLTTFQKILLKHHFVYLNTKKLLTATQNIVFTGVNNSKKRLPTNETLLITLLMSNTQNQTY